VGEAYQIPTVALRYFNVYGPRQALSNPYTGVAAIFSSRILNKRPPVVFEDGLQKRDFIHVSDIVQANLKVLQSEKADGKVLNVGTGRAVSVLDIAESLSLHLGFNESPEIVNQYRIGDIRHCFADISRARELLDYEPQVSFDDGMRELAEWVSEQHKAEDKVETCRTELEKHNLIR
jgi:dTDP-L-rhamnose 4-epimerase